MNRDPSPPREQQKAPKTAILLYGYLRTYEATVASFHRHVSTPLDADLFYFGPAETDAPTGVHKGFLDRNGYVKENPKNAAEQSKTGVDQRKISEVYGTRLKAVKFHTEPTETFRAITNRLSADEWLFKLDPTRLFSMFYNMSGAYDVMAQYEADQGFSYDQVVLTRPDLSFYGALQLELSRGEVHIPNGEGFSLSTGRKLRGNAPSFFYKNAVTGEIIPTGHSFNDQIIALRREGAAQLGTIFLKSQEYADRRVPLTPETILFFHFCVVGGLTVMKNDWLYEITRFGVPAIINITDIRDVAMVDPYNPKARELTRQSPIAFFVRRSLRGALRRLAPLLDGFLKRLREVA